MAAPETLAAALPEDLEADITALLADLCAAELKVATAESCTGGLIASLMTDVDGCGHAFDRGFVTYTDDAKAEMIAVPRDLLRDFSAVSGPLGHGEIIDNIFEIPNA